MERHNFGVERSRLALALLTPLSKLIVFSLRVPIVVHPHPTIVACSPPKDVSAT
ncbi:unnamed protein product [Dovyalis caffra]|uniref:Uncharacterized protein n=1 Tax=Dovyalis caffra TaxID=77055 RepID=A0AAV1RG21_9ROSI|nr:unnamed protein product [Dovyalis caffra]